MKKIILAALLSVLLVGCEAPPTVVPVVEKFNPTDVLAKPPADAMVAPVDPTPLPYGASNSTNSAIMKENNLNGANDRAKLRTLQQYVKNIFSPQK